jgi:hypothetical protein
LIASGTIALLDAGDAAAVLTTVDLLYSPVPVISCHLLNSQLSFAIEAFQSISIGSHWFEGPLAVNALNLGFLWERR